MKITTLSYILLSATTLSTGVYLSTRIGNEQQQQSGRPGSLPPVYMASPDDKCNCTKLFKAVEAGISSEEEYGRLLSECEKYRRENCYATVQEQNEEFEFVNESLGSFDRIPEVRFSIKIDSVPDSFIIMKYVGVNKNNIWTILESEEVWRIKAPYRVKSGFNLTKSDSVFIRIDQNVKPQFPEDIHHIPGDNMEGRGGRDQPGINNDYHFYCCFKGLNEKDVWLVKKPDKDANRITEWDTRLFEPGRHELLRKLIFIKHFEKDASFDLSANKNAKKFRLLVKNTNSLEQKYIIGLEQNNVNDNIRNDLPYRTEFFNLFNKLYSYGDKWKLQSEILGGKSSKTILALYKKWLNSDETISIIELLPPVKDTMTPYQALGNPKPEDTMPPNIKKALKNGESLNMLVKESDLYKLWKNDKDVISITREKNRWLQWLRMADSELKIISDRNDTLIFSFLKNNVLWAFIPGDDDKAPDIRMMLSGDKTSELAGKSLTELFDDIKSNGLSTTEVEFFLNTIGDKSDIILDWEITGSSASRVILIADQSNPSSLQLRRIGAGYDSNIPISFHCVDIPCNSWSSLRHVYSTYRNEFIDRLRNSGGDNLEAWYSVSRFAACYTDIKGVNNVSIFLEPGRRDRFNNEYNLDKIIRLANGAHEIIYKKGLVTKTDLMRGWLSSDWTKIGAWRANPLGYLDRANDVN